MRDLAGKVAVVTGGASGIGRAMAERFAREGMKLALVDIEQGTLEAAATALRAGGTEVLPCCVDVADADAMDALGEDVIRHFGAAHVICNNAGVASGGPMWELSTRDWEFTLRPNLWGVIHGVRVFGKHLVAQNEGHVVNTASMAGLVSAPGLGPYNVTKHAVVTLSETLAGDLEAVGSKVGVSVLCPGFVSTQLWDSERNRDPSLKNADSSNDDEYAERAALFKAVIDAGIPAESVAEMVLDAIEQEHFYIFTHKGTRAALEARFEAILAMEKPAVPEDGAGLFME
jgi:NAD(P)-dependent dehydrogenase (short-subunit alcohol dehydrogenase family)